MIWTEQEWQQFEAETLKGLAGLSEAAARAYMVRRARLVMRKYTTSFYLVSRFLPRPKSDLVEIIYAAVRYPDEVVDTFPLSPGEKLKILDTWAAAYEIALHSPSFERSVEQSVPCFVAAFAEVVRALGIPPEQYRAFLAAMRFDAQPRMFATVQDLIDSYIYGSAIVVGSFLTYAYGASAPPEFPRALESARALGIALQLTNFLRDVVEDARRGRLYLPLDLLGAEGVVPKQAADILPHEKAVLRVVRRLAEIAAQHYRKSESGLDAFAPDSRVAIQACIDVYGLLNERIMKKEGGLARRESVPFSMKWKALPAGKYWRIPLAYLKT